MKTSENKIWYNGTWYKKSNRHYSLYLHKGVWRESASITNSFVDTVIKAQTKNTG